MSNDVIVRKCAGTGTSKVLFTCHRADYDMYFEMLRDDILEAADCTIFCFDDNDYYPESMDDYAALIEQFNLIVIPVSFNFIIDESRAKDVDFKYAIEHRIPLLPILVQPNLYEEFNQLANIQVLDRTARDETQESYASKLRKFVNSVLVDDETAQKIKDAFDAYVFLSYRKKDRKYAQEIMSIIHQSDFMRDVAIWYDEFLTVGEDFNDEIASSLLKSKIMALVVTPSINERFNGVGNYVIEKEYPMAIANEKVVVPIEAINTDNEEFRSNFPDSIDPVNKQNKEKLEDIFRTTVFEKGVVINNDPIHLYYIALAYINGIDMERDIEKGLSILAKASELGGIEASYYLSDFYHDNEYYIDMGKSLLYSRKTFESAKARFLNKQDDAALNQYGKAVIQLAKLLSNEQKSAYSTDRQKEIEIINREYFDSLKERCSDKNALMSFMLHRVRTENMIGGMKDFAEECISIDDRFVSTEDPLYYEIIKEIVIDYEQDMIVSEEEDDYDKSMAKIAIGKAKYVSTAEFLRTCIRIWNFYDFMCSDLEYEIEDECEGELINMFSADPMGVIDNLSWVANSLDEEFCFSAVRQILDTILNSLDQYINNDPKNMGALIQFLDQNYKRASARTVFEEFIKLIENDADCAHKLMLLTENWDRSVPFYGRIINLLTEKLYQIKKTDKAIFSNHMIRTYHSHELEKSNEALEACNSLLLAVVNQLFDETEIEKYNYVYYIAMNIPQTYAKKWFEYAIDGYKRLVGERGITVIAKKEFFKKYHEQY